MKTDLPSQTKFMQEALAEAKNAYWEGEIPVGCVIVKEGEIVARAHNTVERERSTVCHAEINALISAQSKIGKFLDGCEMYVTAEPCAMCAGAIVGARIKKLFYGTREERTGCCGSLYNLTQDDRFFHVVPTEKGICEEECKNLLKKFFAERR